MRRTLIALMTIMAFLLSLGAVAIAQEEQQLLDGKLRMGDAITVGAEETVDGDLYIFADDVNVDGTVQGDLIVFGGTVSVGGDVEGDVIVGSGTFTLDGTVAGDIRAGAGQVTTRGDVGEDVLAGTGQLRVDGDVGEDLVFGAGVVNVAGTVGGDVLGETGSYTVTGTVEGTEDVTINERQADVERPNVFVQALLRFASLVILGLLLMWLMRGAFQRAVGGIDDTAGRVVVWGIAFLVGLAVVPLATTLVGILLAILFGWLGLGLIVGLVLALVVFTWLLTVLAAFVVIAILAPLTVGTWLGTRFLPQETPGYLAMAAGVAVLVLLGLVPVLRVLVGLAVTIMGAGAWLQRFQRSTPAEPVLTESEPPPVT